jgi:rod shape-determining protein MreC
MIGRIYLSGHHTSWVILLTDLNSRIPVTIAPGNVQAILAGDNSAAPKLDEIAHTATATLKAGDQVVSSGDGGLLPPGLPVGTVVADGKGGWRVVLLADASQAQDVEILNFARPPEQLPATAQLPVEAAGMKPEAPPPPPTPAPNPLLAASPKPAAGAATTPRQVAGAATTAQTIPKIKPPAPMPPITEAPADADISAEQ